MPKPTSSASVGSTASCLAVLSLLLWVAGWSGVSEAQEQQTPYQKALREVGIAEAMAREVQQLRGHPDYREAISRDGEVEAIFERAQRVLRTAKSGLERAEQTQSSTGFSDSALLARRATGTFEKYEARLRELFAEIEAERAPPPPPPPPPPVDVEQLTPDPRAETAPASEPAGDSESATSEDGLESPALEEVAPAPPPPPPPPRRSSRSPPAKLDQAVDAYFSGDYDTAIRLVSESSFRQRKARAHALLLRAAARYALFLLGGETDYALRGQATEDVVACKGIDSELTPEEDIFSPRFRDFFAAAR